MNGDKQERGLKQLPDGRWQWSFMHRGRYHRHIARTKTEARSCLEKTRTDIRTGRYMEPEKEVETKDYTFEKAVDSFLSEIEANRRARTHTGDKWCAGHWKASKHLAGKMLDEITPVDVNNFKNELLTRKIKNSTCRKNQPLGKRTVDIIMARLKRFFNFYVDLEVLKRSPAKRVKLIREDVVRVRFLTDEEETRLLNACTPPVERLVRFAITTGMRKSEILDLTWGELDFKNQVAVIPALKSKDGDLRTVHLNETAMGILRAAKAEATGANVVSMMGNVTPMPKEPEPTSRVFNNAVGNRMENLGRSWRVARTVAKLNDFHFHDLRHTYASRLVMAGVDLYVVQQLMGHSDIKMTQRYAHLAPSRLREGVAVLDSKLRLTCNPAPEGASEAEGQSRKSSVLSGVPGGS